MTSIGLLARPPVDVPAGAPSDKGSSHLPARPSLAERAVPLGLLGSAIALWLVSLPRLKPEAMTDTGLVSVMPVTGFLALGSLLVGFCLVLRRPDPDTALAVAFLGALVVLLHATPVIAYGSLRYSWAWKHLGVVERIQTMGTLAPTANSFQLYYQWPGFFAVNALLTELAGRDNAIAYAAWAPVFFNLMATSAVVLIARSFTTDRRLVWMTAWLFLLGHWVGQDYFSPQAMNFFLHLAVLGLCLRWFSPRRGSIDGEAGVAAPTQRLGLVVLLMVLLTSIVSSHQLTPFMTLAAATVLVVTRRCTLRMLPLFVGLLISAWLVYVASAFLEGELHELVAAFGRSDNASGKLINLSDASAGQQLVAVAGRALTLAMWMMAVAGAVRLWLRRRLEAAPLALLVAAAAMVLANSYGGEMIFRAYLFSLPFAAFLAASLLSPARGRTATPMAVAATLVVSALMLSAFVLANNGKDRMYRFGPDEIGAMAMLYDQAPPNSRLVSVTSGLPWAFRDYDKFSYLWLGNEPPASRTRLVERPVEVIHDALEDSRWTSSYFVATRSQRAEIDMTGLLPRGSIARIEAALSASDLFEVVYSRPDAVVFKARSAS